ncbi:MAG TPA: hypothetical protein VG994_10865 [Steroidobacteraceae bacterium]|nr:hypothetical protein [Steroidobacteraceae bacterium]
MGKAKSPWAGLATLALLGFCVGTFGVLALFALSGRLAAMSVTAAISVIGLLLGTALATGYAALKLSSAGKVRVALEIGAFIAALLGAEIMIHIVSPDPPSTQHARKMDADRLGVPFDLRTKSEIVAELRAQGIDALPGISREWPRQPRVRQQLPEGLFPLSHASNVEVVECNEAGRYVTFHTDEFGFNNPPGLIASGHVDVAAIGASFTLGHCVANGSSLIARLRHIYPNLANFGMAGSGTLSMLATFREYVEPLKPPLVLWIMHPWTADTRDELSDPVLSRYLDPTFSQHLFERRGEVDQAMRSIAIQVQYEADASIARAVKAAERDRFAGILTLSLLRKRLHLPELLEKPPEAPDLRPWEQSIDLARRATQSWGGRFVVVIMPLYAEVVSHDLAEPLHHEHLAALLRARGVDVIDTVPLFKSVSDPGSLYVMHRNNHPTAEGHRMLAEFITAQLHVVDAAGPRLAHDGSSP